MNNAANLKESKPESCSVWIMCSCRNHSLRQQTNSANIEEGLSGTKEYLTMHYVLIVYDIQEKQGGIDTLICDAVSCSVIKSEKQEPQVGFEPTTSSLPRTRDTPMPLRRVCDNNIGQYLT